MYSKATETTDFTHCMVSRRKVFACVIKAPRAPRYCVPPASAGSGRVARGQVNEGLQGPEGWGDEDWYCKVG